jgi:RNA-directed DNA polymerase
MQACRKDTLCRSREEAETALARMRAWVSANGLTLHPDKTHSGDCRMQGQGFEFLGYRFETGRRWVRKKSLMALRDKIRAKTTRTVGQSIERVIATLNPTLRGWFGYFQQAHRTVERSRFYAASRVRCAGLQAVRP